MNMLSLVSSICTIYFLLLFANKLDIVTLWYINDFWYTQ